LARLLQLMVHGMRMFQKIPFQFAMRSGDQQ